MQRKPKFQDELYKVLMALSWAHIRLDEAPKHRSAQDGVAELVFSAGDKEHVRAAFAASAALLLPPASVEGHAFGRLLEAGARSIASRQPPGCADPSCVRARASRRAQSWSPEFIFGQKGRLHAPFSSDQRWLYFFVSLAFAESYFLTPAGEPAAFFADGEVTQKLRRAESVEAFRERLAALSWTIRERGQARGFAVSLTAARESLGIAKFDHRVFASFLADLVPDGGGSILRALNIGRSEFFREILENITTGRGDHMPLHDGFLRLLVRVGLRQGDAPRAPPAGGPSSPLNAARDPALLGAFAALELAELIDEQQDEPTAVRFAAEFMAAAVENIRACELSETEFLEAMFRQNENFRAASPSSRVPVLLAGAIANYRSGRSSSSSFLEWLQSAVSPRWIAATCAVGLLVAVSLIGLRRRETELVPRGDKAPRLETIVGDQRCSPVVRAHPAPCKWNAHADALFLYYQLPSGFEHGYLQVFGRDSTSRLSSLTSTVSLARISPAGENCVAQPCLILGAEYDVPPGRYELIVIFGDRRPEGAYAPAVDDPEAQTRLGLEQQVILLEVVRP